MHSDVIIVLGARQLALGLPGPAITRRVGHACKLFHAGLAPAVLMCGGATRFTESEAEAMAAVGAALGLPKAAIYKEDQSMNTLENASCAKRKMARHRWSRAVLVTDLFHLPRAIYVFRALGIIVEGNAPSLPQTPSTVLSYGREYIARINYVFLVRWYLKQNGSDISASHS